MSNINWPDSNSVANSVLEVMTYSFKCMVSEKDNLCLYGYPNETWEITLPTETVPTMLPDPILGINFARDNMVRTDWLYLVAVHCDSWLYAVAFFNGADLNATERFVHSFHIYYWLTLFYSVRVKTGLLKRVEVLEIYENSCI